MTAIIQDGIRYVPESRLRRGLRKAAGRSVPAARRIIHRAIQVAGARATPVTSHAREHAYSIVGFGLVDAACFTHSVFTGLLVTGISFFLFEWKVSE